MGVVRLIIKRRIKPETTVNARSLRSEMTNAERRMWQFLRGKQLDNFRFRRQHPVGKYIVDFACVEMKLVIELDGGQHQDQVDCDELRTKYLQSQGWRVLRFWNNDVLGNLDGVLSSVLDSLRSLPPSRPPPERGKE